MTEAVPTSALRAGNHVDDLRVRLGVAVILALHAGLLACSALVHSPVWDEMGHLPAGMAHWQTGVFDLYRVNPPLVRMGATALPFVSGTRFDIDNASVHCPPSRRLEFTAGSAWMHVDGLGFLQTLQVARLCVIPFSLVAGWMCYRTARELYGVWSGFLALMLWCTSPLVLGHGGLITPDVASATTAALAVWALSRWTRQPTWLRSFWTGLALGLAWLIKFTNLVLMVILAAALFYRLLRPGDVQPQRSKWCAQGVTIIAIAVYAINLGYGFERVGTRLGDFQFVSTLFGSPLETRAEPSGNRFAGTMWAAIPVPLPKNYLLGIDVQKRDFEKTMKSYLRGEWRQGGWWYYYLYAFIVKEPMGTLALLLLAVARLPWMFPPHRSSTLMEVLFPAILFTVFVSSQTGFSHHLRYLFPAYPFLYVLASSVAAPSGDDRASRRWTRVAGVMMLATLAESLAVYPHSLSFFNQLVGGPNHGPRHLHNSNVDWGQDALGLAAWAEKHPEARPLQIIFSGGFNTKDLPLWKGDVFHRGLNDDEVQRLQTGMLRDRWVAISAGKIYDPPDKLDRYQYFRKHAPDGKIGYSIYLYDLTKAGYHNLSMKRPSHSNGWASDEELGIDYFFAQ